MGAGARSFKLFWNIHKWTGIVLATILLVTAVTGFLLLIKKKVSWIQPPTCQGTPGSVEDLVSMQRVLAAVFAQDHLDFQGLEDIDRVDFRPEQRVHKVRSVHHYSEMQVCATTGEVLSVATRRSDLFEAIHDGSFWAGWWHDWIMPPASGALAVMIASGLWLWIEPKLWRRKRHRAQRV
jgi:uncharacterized iron-regulated membrane protein